LNVINEDVELEIAKLVEEISIFMNKQYSHLKASWMTYHISLFVCGLSLFLLVGLELAYMLFAV
jgi:hypothetical protein